VRLRRTERFGLAVVLTVAACPALAQDMPAARSNRPYRGLFQSGVQDASQVLTVSGSIGAGYDITSVSGATIGGDTTRELRGGYSAGSAALLYSLSLERISFGASAATGGRLYGGSTAEWLASRSAGATVAMQVLRSTRVTAAEMYRYGPYNLLSLSSPPFESSGIDVPLIDDDVAISSRRYSTVATTAAVTQSIRAGARSTLNLDYTYARSRTSILSRDFQSQRAGATFTRGLTQNLAFNLGYHYRRADYPSGTSRRVFDAHEADAGISFNRPLSLTRRTQLSFSTGSSAYANESGPSSRTSYRISGSARLTHEIGRTWSAALSYARNIGFVDTFEQPITYDSITAAVGGLISRRLQFSGSVRASGGQVGLSGLNNDYRTYIGSTSLVTSLTRNIGLGASYYYLRARFGAGAAVPTGVGPEMERQGVRGYVTVWAPIFSRARRP